MSSSGIVLSRSSVIVLCPPRALHGAVKLLQVTYLSLDAVDFRRAPCPQEQAGFPPQIEYQVFGFALVHVCLRFGVKLCNQGRITCLKYSCCSGSASNSLASVSMRPIAALSISPDPFAAPT